MNTSDSIKELATALAKAQAKMKTADKGSLNPHFKSKYASLEEVWEAARPALTSEGLSIVQGTEKMGDSWVLKTVLMHTSGESVASYTPLFLPNPANMQHLGSAVTYAKRISLTAMAGISVGEVDDDGDQNRVEMEKAQAKKEVEANEFKRHWADLVAVLKSSDLGAEKLLELAKIRATEMRVSGTEILRQWNENRTVFVDEYKEFLRK